MIKSYKKFNESKANSVKDVMSICAIYDIIRYTVNKNLSIDVDYDVDLAREYSLTNLPITFNRVDGLFDCSYSDLESLEGSPREVIGDFYCQFNKLESLEGCPDIVRGSFYCLNNSLESLEYLPKIISGDIICSYNNIKSFKGVPENFNMGFNCIENPIEEIFKLFNRNVKCITLINEFDVIRGNSVILDRLEEVFSQLEMDIPIIEEINGYKLV